MDHSNIPSELREHLSVTEEVYISSHPSVQSVLLQIAEDRYHEFLEDEVNVEHEDFPIDSFTITVEERNEKMHARGKTFRWRRRDIIAKTNTPIVLTPNNIGDFGKHLDMLRDQYTTDEFKPCQYILSGNGYYDNTAPNSSHLASVILHRLDDYEEGSYVIDSFVVRLKKGYQREQHHGGITAGNGEGIPRRLSDGYWSLDIVQSKTKCIQNAYVLWTMYRDGRVDEVIQGDRSEFTRHRRSLPSGNDIKFNDIVPKDTKFDILYDETNAFLISALTTKKTCWFLYINGHVSLLVHEKYLDGKSITRLEELSRCTVLHKILPKKPNDEFIDIVTADIESFRRLEISFDTRDQHEHEPLLIGQYDGDKFVYFRGNNALDDYCEHLVDADKDWLIWFHNGGKYDVHLLFAPMLKYCDKSLNRPMDLRDLRGNLLQVTYHLCNGNTVTFRDSCSLIPGSLAKLAKDMQVTRKMEDIDIKNVSRKKLLHSPKILEYNRLDCISLYEILDKYQSTSTEMFGTNPLHCVSASSFAKRIFYSKYYKKDKYPLYVFPKHVRDFIATAYHGGRNEVFRRGRFTNKPIFAYDFAAFYSHVGTNPLPYDIPQWRDNLDNIKGKDAIKKFLEDNPGFYEVEILSSPRDKLPLFGTLHEFKFIFPYFVNWDGERIFSKELLLGLRYGYRFRLKCGYTQPLAPICKKFFKKLHKTRAKAKKNGQPALEKSCKTTSSAGYGYFGFNPYNRNVLRAYGENMVEHLESLADNGQLSYRKEDKTYICYERTNIFLPDINVSVAAAITSYARMRLWELLQDILDHGGEIYYCDTDSVYSSIDIQLHPILGPKWCGPGNGTNLGELKRELPIGEDIVDMTLVGCKTYGFVSNKGKYHVKSKGTNNPKPMDKPMENDDKYDDPFENYDKDVIEYQRNKDMFAKLCALLTSPQIFHTETIKTSRMRKINKDMKIYDEVVPKKITGEYTKGIVLSNGKVIPRRLTNKIVTEPTMDDFMIRQISKHDGLEICDNDNGYETDGDLDDGNYIPKFLR